MKFDLRYLLLVFFFPFISLFDRFMYPLFKMRGMTYLDIGIIDAAFSAASLVVIYYFGHMSDRIGRKKSLAAFIGLYAPFPLIYSKVTSLLGGIITRAVQSSSALLYVTETCYVQDFGHKVPTKSKASFFGFIAAVCGLGSFLYPLLGGHIIETYGFEILAVSSSLVAVALAAVVLALPEPMKIKRNNIKNKMNFGLLVKNSTTKALSFYYFLSGITLVITFIWIPFLSLETTNSYAMTGLVISASSFFLIFGRIPFGYMADRIGKNRTFAIGGVLLPLSLILLAFSNNAETLITASILSSLASSIMAPAEGGILSEKLNKETRGGTLNAFEFLSRCGVIVGSLLGGLVTTFLGIMPAFLAAAAAQSVAIILFSHFVRK